MEVYLYFKHHKVLKMFWMLMSVVSAHVLIPCCIIRISYSQTDGLSGA